MQPERIDGPTGVAGVDWISEHRTRKTPDLNPSKQKNAHEQLELFQTPPPDPLQQKRPVMKLQSTQMGPIRMTATDMSFDLAVAVLSEAVKI